MITKEILDIIEKSRKIGVTFHQSPDGDSLGSSTALVQGLRALSKEVYIISKEVVPDTFTYLRCADEITGLADYVQEDTDLVIVVDCGDFKRINGNLQKEARDYAIVNIDHHMSNEKYGDLNYVDTKSAAVGEIIFDILNLLKAPITKDIAVSLYTSLLTDTSSFKHSNTTSRTHEVASKLLETGVDFNAIQRRVFDNKDFKKIKFFGKVIETINLQVDGKVAYMEITDEMLLKSGLESMDSAEVIHFGTMIEGVEVVALFKEAKGGVKVSLRSKEKVDVAKIAEIFNGGGHVRAAGLFYEGTMSAMKEKLNEILENELI